MRYHLTQVRMALIKKSTNSARFGSTYTKIGTIQRRLAWPLRKDDTQIREAFHICKKKKSTNSKCWRGCGEKGMLLHYWWECKLIQPLWKTVWRFLKKLGIKPPYDPAIPLLGIYPKEARIKKTRASHYSLQHYL